MIKDDSECPNYVSDTAVAKALSEPFGSEVVLYHIGKEQRPTKLSRSDRTLLFVPGSRRLPCYSARSVA